MANGAVLGQIPKGGMAAELIVDKISGVTFTDVTATNKDTGEILQASEDSNRYKFLAYKYGNYEVSLNFNGRPIKNDIIVDVCKQYKFITTNPDLNANSWADISEIASKGMGASMWSVGDAKEITLNGTIASLTLTNYKTWVYILGFNHNAEREGNNLIHFGCFRNGKDYSDTNSIALVDNNYNYQNSDGFSMNRNNLNTGGWESSQMRNTIINANATSVFTGNTFLNALPNDLKAVLKRCIKYTCNRPSGTSDSESYITPTSDWAFLLSEFEVEGRRVWASIYEQDYQQQYEYYRLGNSMIKYKHNNPGGICIWWCRSLYITSTENFCDRTTQNYSSTGPATWSYGFAPAFCV